MLSQLREAVTECASKFPVPVLSSDQRNFALKSDHFQLSSASSLLCTQVGSHNADRPNSSDKFVLTTTDQLKVLSFPPFVNPTHWKISKVVVTLTGDSISAAEINLKLPRPHAKDAYHNTGVREDVPWKLQQVEGET